MDTKLKEFLNIFKKEADDLVNEYVMNMQKISGMGLDGYATMRLKFNPDDIEKALNDYKKLTRAFMILSADVITKEHREKNPDTGELTSKITVDETAELNRQSTPMNFSNVKDIARSILSEDRHSFYELILESCGNKSQAQRYTAEVFGKGVRHS